MVQPFFTLNENMIVEISREGGYAYIPKLTGLRRIFLTNMQRSQREKFYSLINQLRSYSRGKKPHSPPRGGDQRYFLIKIRDNQPKTGDDIVLEIPEHHMPPALTQLWRTGSFEDPVSKVQNHP